MKLSFLVKKRQLILAGLVVVLGIAVYLNWEFSQKDLELNGTDFDDKVYGETQATGVEVSETTDAYFAEARLNRQKKRDEAIENVMAMLEDTNLTENQKTSLSDKATELVTLSNCEASIEELVKAKGFKDCVVFVDGESASVIVPTNGLTNEQAAQIFEIVLSKTKINSEKINIVEAK